MEITRVNPLVDALAASATSALTPQQRAEQRQLIQAVEALNKAEIFGQSNELTFVIDRYDKKPVLRLIDKETKEVIRQIPPEYVLRLAEELDRQ